MTERNLEQRVDELEHLFKELGFVFSEMSNVLPPTDKLRQRFTHASRLISDSLGLLKPSERRPSGIKKPGT